MTKQVRIENADTGPKKLVVEVWEKTVNGPDKMTKIIPLDHPTWMATETIWDSKYLVVRESTEA